MRLRAYLAISADGYVADADGGVGWLEAFGGDGVDYGYHEFIAGIGALVMGRTTFDQVLTFGDWPYGDTPCFIHTSRPVEHPVAQAWSGTAASLAVHLRGLAEGGDLQGDVWLVGGPENIRHFHDAGLVDSYELHVMPIVLGDGIPMFPQGIRGCDLRLARSHAYPDGVVELTYTPVYGASV